jgi:hypothetical protein
MLIARLGPERYRTVLAALGGVLIAVATLVGAMVSFGRHSGTTTTLPVDRSTTLASTTTVPLDPTAEATLYPKTATPLGQPTGRLIAVRAAKHEGYTRVVFEFSEGGIPGFWIGYTDPTHIAVIISPVDPADPFDQALFPGGGAVAVGLPKVSEVLDNGLGADGNAWEYQVIVSGQSAFSVGALDGPPGIYPQGKRAVCSRSWSRPMIRRRPNPLGRSDACAPPTIAVPPTWPPVGGVPQTAKEQR